MAEEMPDRKIKNEEQDSKDDWEENEARYKEYIFMQNEAMVKIETTNDFEETQNWTIKKEELDIKEDLEENNISISHCDCQDNHQVKCERCTAEKSHQFDDEISLKSNLYRKLSKSDHCMDKIVEETSSKRIILQNKDLEESKADLLNQKEVEMFKCNKCDFQTIHQCSLKRHVLLHNNEMFKCNKCNFQTKHKNYLKTHLLRHNSSEEVKKFKCDQCSYKTFLKYDLKRHFMRHRNPGEVKIFKCDDCSYKTIRKYDLKKHFLRHKNPEEIEMFKCNSCCYMTILKTSLTRHLLRHRIDKGS